MSGDDDCDYEYLMSKGMHPRPVFCWVLGTPVHTSGKRCRSKEGITYTIHSTTGWDRNANRWVIDPWYPHYIRHNQLTPKAVYCNQMINQNRSDSDFGCYHGKNKRLKKWTWHELRMPKKSSKRHCWQRELHMAANNTDIDE